MYLSRDKVAQSFSKIQGVSKVFVADNSAYEHGLAENLAPLIADCQKQENFSYILAPASSFGKNLTPRLAGILDTQAISDIISIENENTFKFVIASPPCATSVD